MQRGNLKTKALSALAAIALAVGLVPMSAFGAGELTLDGSITVGGLDAGDSAKYIQIIEQDVDTEDPAHQGTQAWKLTAAVDENGDGIVDGTESNQYGRVDAENNPILGLCVEDLVITDDPVTSSTDTKVITAAMSNDIAAAVTKNGAAGTAFPDVAGEDGKVTAEDVAAGLYMVVAVPGAGNIDTIYKPIYVSADYNATDGTNSIEVVADETDYKPVEDVEATFKRSSLDIDKVSGHPADSEADPAVTADGQHDVAVGDVVDFTITLPVPTYSKNYTDPVFKVTDTLTSGLELVHDSIEVSVKYADSGTVVPTTEDVDYTITENGVTGFVVEFLNDNPNTTDVSQDGFLYNVLGAPIVTITYQATVTKDAVKINQMDNTVTLDFSNAPDDETGEGTLKDKTRHYTFNIDANIFGRTVEGGPTTEIRKIAVNPDGTIIEEIITTDIPEELTDYSWLEGAEFELKQTHVYEDPYNAPNANPTEVSPLVATPVDGTPVIKFDADSHIRVSEGGVNPKSDSEGYIPMLGLDAGIYILREIKAPAGYTYDPSVSYQIEIKPTYATEGASSTDETDENIILKSYEVTITKLENGEATDQVTKTTYTAPTDDSDTPISFLNEDGTPADVDDVEVIRDEDSETTYIINKKLGILPATGGSGIFFYLGIGGAIAAVALFFLSKNKREIDELTN